jgi:hypothetical protein
MLNIVRRAILAFALAATSVWPFASLAALNSYIIMGPEGDYYFLAQVDIDAVLGDPTCKKDCLIFVLGNQEASANVADLEKYIVGDASETLAKAIPDEALLTEVGQAIKDGQTISDDAAAKLEQLGIGVVSASWPPPHDP